MSRVSRTQRAVVAAIKTVRPTTPVNQRFLADMTHAIEELNHRNRRQGSPNYKPSSMACLRQMYYTRTAAPRDERRDGYQNVGMADTGTRRHEAMQEVLLAMQELGFPWKYWDVEDFLKTYRWPEQRCLNLKVVRKDGAETLLKDEVLHLSFKCDGIVEHLEDTTGDPFYLWEFKNQVEFKAQKKAGSPHIDVQHHVQVEIYCAEFDLNKALVTYENRNACDLYVPEVFEVSQPRKQAQISRLLEAESYAERGIPPPKPPMNPKDNICKWCSYKSQCFKDK